MSFSTQPPTGFGANTATEFRDAAGLSASSWSDRAQGTRLGLCGWEECLQTLPVHGIRVGGQGNAVGANILNSHLKTVPNDFSLYPGTWYRWLMCVQQPFGPNWGFSRGRTSGQPWLHGWRQHLKRMGSSHYDHQACFCIKGSFETTGKIWKRSVGYIIVLCQCYCPAFKKWLIERQSDRVRKGEGGWEGGREIRQSSICWFTSQMATIAKPRWCLSQKSGTPPQTPTWLALEPYLLPPMML